MATTLLAAQLASAMIQKFEAFSPVPYFCPAGLLTIGYGHTAGVKKTDRVNKEQALRFLANDSSEFETAIQNAVKVPMQPHQEAALISFTFNVGMGGSNKDGFVRLRNGQQSTMLKKINSGDYSGAAQEFTKWVHIKGMVNDGLVKRRIVERAVFRGRDFETSYSIVNGSNFGQYKRESIKQDGRINVEFIYHKFFPEEE